MSASPAGVRSSQNMEQDLQINAAGCFVHFGYTLSAMASFDAVKSQVEYLVCTRCHRRPRGASTEQTWEITSEHFVKV